MFSRSCWRRSTDPPPCAAPSGASYQLSTLECADVQAPPSAHSGDSNYAYSVPLVPSSVRRSRARSERSAIARAAIAATTRTQIRSSLLISLSGDCGAERTDHRRRAVSGPRASAPRRSPSVIAAFCVGGPRRYIGEKDIGRWRGPPPTACACPPTRPQRALWESCITYWAWASSLRLSFHSCNAFPSYEYLGCYF